MKHKKKVNDIEQVEEAQDEEKRFVNLESLLVTQERILDELNAEMIRIATELDRLQIKLKQHKNEDHQKEISTVIDEPPPPHY